MGNPKSRYSLAGSLTFARYFSYLTVWRQRGSLKPAILLFYYYLDIKTLDLQEAYTCLPFCNAEIEEVKMIHFQVSHVPEESKTAEDGLQWRGRRVAPAQHTPTG